MYTIEEQDHTAPSVLTLLAGAFDHLKRSSDQPIPPTAVGQLFLLPAHVELEIRAGYRDRVLEAIRDPHERWSQQFWDAMMHITSELVGRTNLLPLHEAFTPVQHSPHDIIDIMVYMHQNRKIPSQPIGYTTGRYRFNFVSHNVKSVHDRIYISPKNFLPGASWDTPPIMPEAVGLITVVPDVKIPAPFQ